MLQLTDVNTRTVHSKYKPCAKIDFLAQGFFVFTHVGSMKINF